MCDHGVLVKGRGLEGHEHFGLLTTMTDKTVTLAEVSFSINETEYIGTGFSHRMRGDKYDEYTGNLIAVHRAVEKVEQMLYQERMRLGF